MLSTRQPTSTPIQPVRRGCRQICTIGGAAVLGLGLLMGPIPLASAAPSSEAIDAIHHRYADFGGNTGMLGAPMADAVDIQGGVRQDFSGGAIFYSPQTGAKVMYGAILEKYRSMGGPEGSGLGFPLNDETAVGDGVGRYNDFSQPGGASIYWTPSTGANAIRGKLLDAWRASGATTGPFGYPSSDMTDDNGVSVAKFVGPQGTEMRWSDSAGLATVPTALAASIPGFRAGTAPGGTAPAPGATTPGVTTPGETVLPTTPNVTVSPPAVHAPRHHFNWWPLVIGLGLAALLASLLGLTRRRRPAPEVHTTYTKPEPPVAPRVTETRVPPRVRDVPPPPVVPKVAERPVERRVVETNRETVVKRPVMNQPRTFETPVAPPPRTPVVNYDAERITGIEVTYENNAIGANQQSREDKSDTHLHGHHLGT